MSQFANNIEKFAFLKADWPMVEVSADGNTIYMGRPSRPDAVESDKCWLIKKVVITEKPDAQIIQTTVSDNNVAWVDRHSLTYKYC